jgi:hypothetical protein
VRLFIGKRLRLPVIGGVIVGVSGRLRRSRAEGGFRTGFKWGFWLTIAALLGVVAYGLLR